MVKVRTVHRCSDCGAAFPKWAGRCTVCGEWNSLVEEVEVAEPAARARSASAAARSAAVEPAVPIADVDLAAWATGSTGLPELDRVLGGGLVPGSVTLVGGEPGIGKSTLLLQLLGAVASQGRRALLITGEESAQQVRLRAERLGALQSNLWLAAETSMPLVLAHLAAVRPEVVVIDSIQTMTDPELQSAPGSVTQVRECAHALVRVAKDHGIAVLLVGHVTKDGSLAGPRVLEHVVDTVLSFEGDRHHALRLLRAVKHRFGATGELGLFEMVEQGLVAVADPSALFLGDRRSGLAGSVVVPAMEGARPLLVEVQALVARTESAMPRRNVQGLDGSRLALLLAVLDRRLGVDLGGCDVFSSVVGGVRITEPAADLSVALALLSSWSDVPLPEDLVAVGEIGLGGEVRQVGHGAQRLSEAKRLGFTTALVPQSIKDPGIAGLTLIRVGSLDDAARRFDLLRQPAGRGRGRGRGGGGARGIEAASRGGAAGRRAAGPFIDLHDAGDDPWEDRPFNQRA